MKSIAQFNRVPAHTLYRQYKEFSSGFRDWEQARHAEEYMLFEENIGPDLGIDEVTLSRGELYTYVTNKAAKGGKGSIVASIKGTRSEDIQAVLDRIPADKREQVEQISLDMAKNIESAVTRSFPNAIRVTDRFHVVRLVLEPVQQLRVKLRWQEMDAENKAIKQARKAGVAYKAERLDNGDTPKQLLARCRHALFKPEEKWTKNQWLRVYFAFERYPELKRAYDHAQKLIRMYRLTSREKAEIAFKEWIQDSYDIGIEGFASCARTVENHLDNIVNFFHNRATNASAESFNAKIKQFRANQRGVRDPVFFLFRLSKLFA